MHEEILRARVAAWPANLGQWTHWFLQASGPATWVYWLGALGSYALLVYLSARLVFRRPPQWATSEPLYLFVLTATLVLWRWPSLMGSQLNLDESQIVSGLYRLAQDPVFYRSVDGTTNGPMQYYLLVWPAWLGLPLDYGWMRLAGWLVTGAALSWHYLALRTLFSAAAARAATLPLISFFLAFTCKDALQYSSVFTPIAALALGEYLLARLYRGQPVSFGLGVTVGASFLAKLQVGPPAAVLVLGGLAVCWRQPRALLGLLAGLVSVPVGVGLAAWILGVGDEFYRSYLVSNLSHLGVTRHNYPQGPVYVRLSWIQKLAILPGMMAHLGWWRWLGWVVLGLGGLASRFSPPLVFAGLFMGAGIAAAVAPGNGFLAHTLFLVFPSGLLVGVLFGGGYERRPGVPWLLLVGLATGLQWVSTSTMECDVTGAPLTRLRTASTTPSLELDAFTPAIWHYARPGESLAVWGYLPTVFVTAGMIPATRETITERQIEDRYDQDYFVRRYLADLALSRPPVFVDSVGVFGYLDRSRYGHEIHPALAEYVRAHYQFVGEIGAARLYVAKARLSQKAP